MNLSARRRSIGFRRLALGLDRRPDDDAAGDVEERLHGIDGDTASDVNRSAELERRDRADVVERRRFARPPPRHDERVRQTPSHRILGFVGDGGVSEAPPVLDVDVRPNRDVGSGGRRARVRSRAARPSMMPWSAAVAPTCTLTRMNFASAAAATASAARASFRRTLIPSASSGTAERTAQAMRVIAAIVLASTLSLKNGTSPKFSRNAAWKPTSRRRRASSTTCDSISASERSPLGEPGQCRQMEHSHERFFHGTEDTPNLVEDRRRELLS